MDISEAILLALGIGCIWWVTNIVRAERTDGWHFAGGTKMRRKIKGEWQYREQTDQEREDHNDTLAI